MDDDEVKVCNAVAAIPAKGLQLKPEHKAEWVRRFDESGLSYTKFSALHGLRLASLWNWVQRERQGREELSAAAFTEIKLPEPPQERPSWSAELSFADGKTLRLSGEVPPAVLEQLLSVC